MSSSSFRARLESLPLYYSAPAGGYAPMPSPDDAPGIGDRGQDTGPTVKVGPDGYGVVVTTGGAGALSGPASARSASGVRSAPSASAAAGVPSASAEAESPGDHRTRRGQHRADPPSTTPPASAPSTDGVMTSEPGGRTESPTTQSVSESASTPDISAAPIYGVVQAPAPAGYGVVQPRPRRPQPAEPSGDAEILDSPIFGTMRIAAPERTASPEHAATPDIPAAPSAPAEPPAPAESPALVESPVPAESPAPAEPPAPAESPALVESPAPIEPPAPAEPSTETTYGILPPSPAAAATFQETVLTPQEQAVSAAGATDPGGLDGAGDAAAPAPIAWESVSSAASEAAALPLSQQTAKPGPNTEEAPAGSAEIALPSEEPEPEPDTDVLPDGVPEDGVYVDVDVAIVMESTYPYLKGGVSAVVHDIITGNPELTFGIIHITWDSNSPRKDLYGMPDNVAWVRVLYLSMEEHQEDFLRARPRDLRMNRRQRRELSRRILGAMLSLAQEGRTEPLWEIIGEGLSASRRYPIWAILGTREFMEAYHDMMPDLGMSMTDIFWCLRDFFSLAYAVLAEPVPRAQVYHAHTTGYAMLLGVNAAREHGTKVLLTEHNLYVRDTVNTLLERRLDLNIRLTDYRTFDVTGRERMWMAWWLEMGRLCYPYAYASTYLYPRAITEANELGGDAGRAIVIPNGIVTSEFDASYAARLAAIEEIKKEGADKHLWKLVYIARVVPIKGLLDMIDSVRLMVDRGLNIHLDVCGPTEHMPSYFEQCLTRIVEQGLESVITIRGTVKVRELLPEFDLFVLPSYNEGLPVVSLETMGAGIPTVSTDVGAVRSVVEDLIVTDEGETWDPCGIIIEPGDPAVMADKVQEVISDVELYERLSLNARGRVEAAYDLVKVNASYNKIYRQGGAGEQTHPGP